MVGGAVENQEDILPGKLSRQGGEEDLKARHIRSRHDQIDTSPILRRDRAVQIDVFANELGGDLGLMPIGAQHGRGRLMRPKRASSANRDPQVTASPSGSPLGFPHGIWKAIFKKRSEPWP